nr:MAG TPA: hypothetical protein [Caudoviricetes sp.]
MLISQYAVRKFLCLIHSFAGQPPTYHCIVRKFIV